MLLTVDFVFQDFLRYIKSTAKEHYFSLDLQMAQLMKICNLILHKN